MCTSITHQVGIAGSAKGAAGWMAVDTATTGYDHPAHIDLEHAISLDFVASGGGPGARVAVELTRDGARAVIAALQAALAEADAMEGEAG